MALKEIRCLIYRGRQRELELLVLEEWQYEERWGIWAKLLRPLLALDDEGYQWYGIRFVGLDLVGILSAGVLWPVPDQLE